MTDRIDCSRARALVPAAVDDALDAADAAALELHLSACSDCRARLESEREADRATREIYSAFVAPSPPAGFADRVVDRLVSEPLGAEDRLWRSHVAPSPPPGFADRVIAALRRGRWTTTPGFVRLAAAAAVLLAFGALGVRELRRSAPRPPAEVATEWITVDELVRRSGGGARLEYVVHRQFPDGIGAFDATPAIADLSRRATGNEFHRALRESLAGSSR